MRHLTAVRRPLGVTFEALAQCLCDGARGTNQAVPPIPIDDLHLRYRQIIEAILFGAASLPAGKGGKSSGSTR